MSKPRIWHWQDLFLYIVPTAFTLMAWVGLYLNNRPGVESAPIPAQLLLFGMPLLVWALTLIPLYVHRILFIRSIKFITKQGVMVRWTDDKYAVEKEDVEEVIEDVIHSWHASTYLRDKIKSDNGRQEKIRAAVSGNLVIFREHPFELHQRYGKTRKLLAGVHSGEVQQVGWKEDIKKTALKHELGHDIIEDVTGLQGGTWSADPMDDPHHKIMEDEGLM